MSSLTWIYVLQLSVICITKDNIENVRKGKCKEEKVLGLFVYTMINRKQYKLMPIYYLISTNAVHGIQYDYKIYGHTCSY